MSRKKPKSCEIVDVRHRRKTGRIAITFEVSPQLWATISRLALVHAHLGMANYVAGQIKAAFLNAPAPTPPPPRDMDDGIPF